MTAPVLAALTPGHPSADVVDRAVAMARLMGRPLVLGSVSVRLPIVPSDLAAGVAEELVDPGDHDELLASSLQPIADAVPGDVSVTVDTTIAPNPVSGIGDLAAKYDAGLIVLGNSDRGIVSRLLDGDPDLGVLRHTACPVLVTTAVAGLRAAPATPTRVGVAWDRSSEADEAVRLAADLAARAGAALDVIHVLQPEAPVFVPPADPKMGRELLTARHTEAETEIRAVLKDQGIAPTTAVEIRHGQPADELVDASASVDLLIVGSRRAGAWRRAISGSVSAHLIHHAHAPVLVVPQRSDATLNH